jgi:uncharacterized protein with FMN-binding domain
MFSSQTTSYKVLLALTIVFSLLAVITLVPNPGASKPNVLGYRSVCSFAPAATALCGVLAGITCTLRNRRFSRGASSARYRPLIVPAGVGVLLLAVALVFGIRFGAAEARFGQVIARTSPPAVSTMTLADGTRRATVTESDVSATVEVTVEGGLLTSLRLVDSRNVPAGLSETLFIRVLAAGTTQVDAVSGATASSNVVLTAAARAAGTP